MATCLPSPIGTTLARAVQRVRQLSGDDPAAAVLVITPSAANGVLARQQLALTGDFIRVDFLPPEGLVTQLGRRVMALRGRRREPSAWLGTTVGHLLHELASTGELGPYGPVLARPGWSGAVTRAVETLEVSGISTASLAQVDLPEHVDRLKVFMDVARPGRQVPGCRPPVRGLRPL